ncbi:MAG: HzsA-related protein, partial [Limisphaerales bacterium]
LKGQEGTQPLQRLTPEVCFPEVEGWPDTWYSGAYPLSEDFYLTGWSNLPLGRQGAINPVNGMGVYLYDAAGNRELIYRDAEISSMDPIPVRSRTTPSRVASNVQWDGQQDGRFLLLNVYDGLDNVKTEIKNLRVVAVPSKTQPDRNFPVIGMTTDDPGKCVLGTVPVEVDGSAYFRVPSGVNVFFQALDAQGMAVQTMRTVSYVQPNQTLSCVGCHESRQTVPQNAHPLAAMREPSKLVPGPEGSWPLRFDQLVQPVLDKKCASCHNGKNENRIAARFDLTAENAYAKLVTFGTPSLKDYISKRYFEGKSVAGEGTAKNSALLAYLNTNSQHKTIKLNSDDLSRLVTWMDCYAQRLGSFSDEQERELAQFKHTMAYLLEQK